MESCGNFFLFTSTVFGVFSILDFNRSDVVCRIQSVGSLSTLVMYASISSCLMASSGLRDLWSMHETITSAWSRDERATGSMGSTY